MQYEARPPRAPLEPFVRCLWRLRGAPHELEPQPIVPDGCFELIVHLGEPLVESSAQKAVFANPEHDFPQRVLYWREGESLCAAVEGPMNGETVSECWCWKPGSLR